MSGLTFLTIVSILSICLIDVSNSTDQDCQTSSSNGYYGFCTSSNCCNGKPVNNLCGGGLTCCYGQNTCQNQDNRCPTVYPRDSWQALNPRNALKNLPPVYDIFIHHTNDGNTCFDNDSCSRRVRSLQSYHQLTKKWDDIAWNFLIGGDGKIYEGVGWKKQGFHTLNWNDKSLGIALIGDFDQEFPDTYNTLDPMLDALDKLITCGINLGYIRTASDGYPKCHGHSDLTGTTTTCPGRYLYGLLKNQFNCFKGNKV